MVIVKVERLSSQLTTVTIIKIKYYSTILHLTITPDIKIYQIFKTNFEQTEQRFPHKFVIGR